ncbi:hypothetical protein [Sorangium sp. So ce1389]|uniref:hypothetical protein n=1 Tax=Sorangium sp. So ce1389 TaxID=3133336 RepID=UPI003F6027C4
MSYSNCGEFVASATDDILYGGATYHHTVMKSPSLSRGLVVLRELTIGNKKVDGRSIRFVHAMVGRRNE